MATVPVDGAMDIFDVFISKGRSNPDLSPCGSMNWISSWDKIDEKKNKYTDLVVDYLQNIMIAKKKVNDILTEEKAVDAGILFEAMYGLADNNVVLQPIIAKMYLKGIGVQKDPVLAFKWYYKAASNNDVDSQYTVGYMYYSGIGVERNYGQALKWYFICHRNNHYLAKTKYDGLLKFIEEKELTGKIICEQATEIDFLKRQIDQLRSRAKNECVDINKSETNENRNVATNTNIVDSYLNNWQQF